MAIPDNKSGTRIPRGAGRDVSRRYLLGVPVYFLMVVLAALTTPYYQEHRAVIVAAGSLSLLFGVVRFTLAMRLLGGRTSPSTQRWFRLSLYGSFLTWGLFAGVTILLYHTEWTAMLVVVMTVAATGAASSALAPNSRLAITGLMMLCFPMGVVSLAIGGIPLLTVGTGTFVYLAFALTFAYMNARSYGGEQHGFAAESARQRAEDLAQARAEFLAYMSHEIRNSLNGVLGMIDLLLHSELRPDQRECAEVAHRAAINLLAILNSTLDLSKIEAGKLQLESIPFDLEDLVRNSLRPLREQANRKGLQFDWDVSSGAGVYLGDPVRIGQVLTNISANAVKFTTEGRVHVRVSAEGTGDEPERVRFQVSDTGVGIAPQALQRLFSDFFQADESISRLHGGTGLGLSISRQLLRLMGGFIDVESTPGKGSTFSFEMPLERVRYAPADAPPKPPDGPMCLLTGTGRILVAEDDDVSQRIAVRLLEKLGYTADAVANGEQAIKAASQHHYDAILMDQHMPRLDGLAAARAIRAASGPGSTVPIIALTASALVEDRQRCLDAGMDEYVVKPIDLAQLGEVLHRVRRSRRHDQ